MAVISDLQNGALAELIRSWLDGFGSDRYLVYEPVSYESVREAHRTVFGRPVAPVYDLSSTDFLLSLGVDFLDTWVSPVQYTGGTRRCMRTGRGAGAGWCTRGRGCR